MWTILLVCSHSELSAGQIIHSNCPHLILHSVKLVWPYTPTKRRGQIISEPTACAVPDAVSEHTTHNRGRYMIINYHCGKGMYTTYTEAILQLFFNHVEQKASFLYKLSLQPYPDCVFA